MRKVKKIYILLVLILFITACSNKEYKVSDEVNITGTISNNETIKDGEYIKKSILNLDKPIVVNGKSVSQIEIDYDKDLKDNSKVTISGTISNSDTTSYGIEVKDVDQEEAYVNTFNNEFFSITIPSSLIKICTIKKIDNGFIVYSTSNMNNGGEVFRIISVTNKKFQELQSNESSYIEKIKSNQKNTIIIMYPTTTEYNDNNFEEYETIANSINEIKNNVTIK
ncbi:MAG: hypothetical protein ACI4WW_07050 [Candidatus Coprovivens sp.]